jgi:hypothetical protein
MNLIRGRWWPALGLQLLMAIIAAIVNAIISQPFSLMAGSGGFFGDTVTSTGDVLINAIGSTIGSIFTTPLAAIAVVLLYFDLRVRKEGLDVRMVADSLDGRLPHPPAPPHGTGTPPAPPAPPPLAPPPPPPGSWGAPPPTDS